MALTQISTKGIKDGTITGTDLATNVDLVDNQKLRLGTSQDLEIYHDGSHSYIADTGTGNLNVTASRVNINNAANSENIARFIESGAVELYHAGSKKFETTTYGATMDSLLFMSGSGHVITTNDGGKISLGDSADLQIFHDGTNSRINNTTGKLLIKDDVIEFVRQADDTVSFVVNEGGSTELYHNHNKKFETNSIGVEIIGELGFSGSGTHQIKFADNQKARFGSSNDLQIYHDGSHSYIDNNTGSLRLRDAGGAEKLKIHGTGVTVTGGLDVSNEIRFETGTNVGTCLLQGDGADLILNVDAFQTKSNSALAFRVDNSEKMRVDSSGNLMIGATDSNARLKVKESANLSESNPHVHIQGNGYALFMFLDGSAAHIGQNSNSRSLRFYSGGTETAGVQLSAGGTSFGSYSDERLKKNIKDIGSVLDKIKDIRCVTYLRKDIENFKETIGFIAQDFIGKFDQVLDSSKVKDTDTEESLAIKYTETIPILLKAIQELEAEVATLKAS